MQEQAKLGVSAEESKAQRLKRQQARFRDRGGAFVPSNSNPLLDILLARTVSGESPSKAPQKRRSPSKPRRSSPRKTGESQPVAASSKSKSRKPVESEADEATKPAAKRRGRPAKKKAPDSADPPTKSKSKGKGKQPITIAPSTSDSNVRPKPKPRTTTKPPKEVVEVLRSDDDQTLVEVPHKAKSVPTNKIRHEADYDTDDDLPHVTRHARPAGDLKAPAMLNSKRVETEKIPVTTKSRKKPAQDIEGSTKTNPRKRPVHDDNDDVPRPVKKGKAMKKIVVESESEPEPAKSYAKRRLVRRDDDDEDVAPPPAKKGRATKPKTVIESESEPLLPLPRDLTNSKTKGKREVTHDTNQDVEEDREQPSKSKKRKKEEDNYDDRPRKAVKFAESAFPHSSSSHKLKENRAERKQKSASKTNAKEDLDAPKLAVVVPLQTRTAKGPPREVLDRIKASAVRHLRCADSEPDELDCLS